MIKLFSLRKYYSACDVWLFLLVGMVWGTYFVHVRNWQQFIEFLGQTLGIHITKKIFVAREKDIKIVDSPFTDELTYKEKFFDRQDLEKDIKCSVMLERGKETIITTNLLLSAFGRSKVILFAGGSEYVVPLTYLRSSGYENVGFYFFTLSFIQLMGLCVITPCLPLYSFSSYVSSPPFYPFPFFPLVLFLSHIFPLHNWICSPSWWSALENLCPKMC